MKIRPVGDELFHVDGQTGMTKLTVAFLNFVIAPINVKFHSSQKYSGEERDLIPRFTWCVVLYTNFEMYIFFILTKLPGGDFLTSWNMLLNRM